MIKTVTKAYQVGENIYANIEDAQRQELKLLLEPLTLKGSVDGEEGIILQDYNLADFILKNSGKIMDILTTTPKSRPSARKANGGTKRRTTVTPTNVLTL